MFEKYRPDSEGINVDDLNRALRHIEQQQEGFGTEPGIRGETGWAPLPRSDMFRFFLIQISAVTTVADASVPVVPAYAWQEVVRRDGVFTRPGDGRGPFTAAQFPAFDVRMAADAPLNAGSTTSAYLAWLSWDERSVEFIGVPTTATGGAGSSFSGAKLTRVGGYNVPNTAIPFNRELIDTDNYHDNAVNSTRITVPTTAHYLVGYNLVFEVGVFPASIPSELFAYSFVTLNGNTNARSVYGEGFWYQASALNKSISINSSEVLQLAASDYLELIFNGTANPGPYAAFSVAAPLVDGTIDLYPHPRFWIQRLGT